MDLSIVIPLIDEAESLPELTAWIERVMNAQRYSYEIIFVDDGSRDNSWEIIQQLRAANTHVKGIKFQRNYGKSAGLNEGFRAATGDVIITMDADMQDSPDEIPELRRMIVEDKFDLVSGWKKVRHEFTSEDWRRRAVPQEPEASRLGHSGEGHVRVHVVEPCGRGDRLDDLRVPFHYPEGLRRS